MLQQQTFLEKCETWMEFLVETEQKLASEISGSYQLLLEQQRVHEASCNERNVEIMNFILTCGFWTVALRTIIM